MADEKKPGLFNWDNIKNALKKSTAGKPDDDDDPDLLSDDPAADDDDDGDDYEDASEVVKALTKKIINLEETIDLMAKAQTAMLEKMKESDVLQKSIGQGIIAIMDRTEEVLASPAPRKGVVTGFEALKKSMGGVAPEGGGVAGSLKPFTPERLDFVKDILTKAVSDGEIDVFTCGKWETHINKSMGKVAYPFPLDFVTFMQNKLGKQGA